MNTSKILILTHVPHCESDGLVYAYGPYVKEMNLWIRSFGSVVVVCPRSKGIPTAQDVPYSHDHLNMRYVPELSFVSWKRRIRSVWHLPYVIMEIYRAMLDADHIHVRCPGNMGLLGIAVQRMVAGKPKTVKYAGNWDPASDEAWTVRLQRRLLRNRYISGSMKVLVYGAYPAMRNHIIPFFTASYSRDEMVPITKAVIAESVQLAYVGALDPGKGPMEAVLLTEKLHARGLKCHLEILGAGAEGMRIRQYIADHGMGDNILMRGAVSAQDVKRVLCSTHFVILVSRTEGWPKAVAEGMFFGAVPIASAVSCIPWMLEYGKRGIVYEGSIDRTVNRVIELVENEELYLGMSRKAMKWAREYTMERFAEAVNEIVLC